MAIPCRSCPFTFTPEAEVATNSGCLPSGVEILQMKRETGDNWACHSNCNRICQGMVNEAPKMGKIGEGLDFTTGELIHDFDNVHSRAEWVGGFPKEIAHWGSCETCNHRVEVCSHPWYDGKPVTNKIGYACAVQLVIPNEKEKSITMLRPGSIGCELHEDYRDESADN